MDRCTDILTKRTAGFPGSSVTQAALDDVGQITEPVTVLSTREYCGGHVYADGRLERTLPRPGLRTYLQHRAPPQSTRKTEVGRFFFWLNVQVLLILR